MYVLCIPLVEEVPHAVGPKVFNYQILSKTLECIAHVHLKMSPVQSFSDHSSPTS